MTYRTLSFILLVAVVGLSFALWHQIRRHEIADYTKLDSVRLIRNHRDSLTHVILATQDTLYALRGVFASVSQEIATAKANSAKTNKEHEAVTFKSFDSDSARFNEWARHFPSLRNR